MNKILVTGGTGYIGSHTCVELIESGYVPIILDNLSNSKLEVLNRIETITGERPVFYNGDIRDKEIYSEIFLNHDICAVIHFAGLKAVGESCRMPFSYYDNNVCGTVFLIEAMEKHHIKNLVFSSSATVYGDPDSVPISEDFPLSATNPYGRSKLIIEEMIRDLPESDKLIQSSDPWAAILLRYFNPVGAHESGLIREDPNDMPNNLLPYVSQVAIGKLKELSVFGDDYPTVDGTGVRDYIHVVDLAKGHVKSIEKLLSDETNKYSGVTAINLGTGVGTSVLEMVSAFEKASKKAVPYKISARRSGDIASCYADSALARELLDWEAEFSLEDMVNSSWNWQVNNPDGY